MQRPKCEKQTLEKKDLTLKKQNIVTFEEAVEYLYDVPRFTRKNLLEDTGAYLQRLGNPDRKMHIIHVAGTNGKGSVCAYLRHILEAAGKKVAVFTSPHLVDVRERFLINGKMIEKQVFLDAFLQIYESLDWGLLEDEDPAVSEPVEEAGTDSCGFYHPTFFEYLFFMAMIIFSKEDIDYCILETGLGGRLDATNAVSRKELSVITRIGLDHVEYLGDTMEKIAGEKAGIMQEGAPVVYLDADAEATAVFVERAAELGIPAYSVSKKDYAFLNFKNKSIDFSVSTRYYGYVRAVLHTIARYQMENAALAVRAIEVLDEGRTISAEAIVQGLGNCVWAGRMEEILPEVYVDGAHNEDGIRAFLETVREDGYGSHPAVVCSGEDNDVGFSGEANDIGCSVGANGLECMERKRSLLFSVVSDKDYESMIRQLAESGLFHRIAIAHMHTGRAASLDSIRELFDRYPSCNYNLYAKVDEALQALLDSREEGERIYIAGSLYLVGEIKESLDHD